MTTSENSSHHGPGRSNAHLDNAHLDNAHLANAHLDNAEFDEAQHMDSDEADITVPLATKQLWQPGPKLAARVAPARARPHQQHRRDPRLLAAAILITAAAVAAALWLTALWLRASDDANDDPEAALTVAAPGPLMLLPGQSGPTVITLYDMTGPLKSDSRA